VHVCIRHVWGVGCVHVCVGTAGFVSELLATIRSKSYMEDRHGDRGRDKDSVSGVTLVCAPPMQAAVGLAWVLVPCVLVILCRPGHLHVLPCVPCVSLLTLTLSYCTAAREWGRQRWQGSQAVQVTNQVPVP
jgi:hypothetical protein